MEAFADSQLDFGRMDFGCKHYRRRCMIRAPCCNEIFPCRHCHNESTSESDRHEISRQDVRKVICLICDTEQPVAQVCSNCGVKMGEYFCGKCKFYDDTWKEQYHCDDCGICRVGGRDNFFHCQKCGSCYSVELRDKHSCVENSMRHHCAICYEYLFDSLKETRVLKRCGHTLHQECFMEMVDHSQLSCPICFKSVYDDMSGRWQKLDEEIEATLMPEDYRYKVWILCNDCNKSSEVFFHIIAHKCQHCHSYNTRTIAPPPVLPR